MVLLFPIDKSLYFLYTIRHKFANFLFFRKENSNKYKQKNKIKFVFFYLKFFIFHGNKKKCCE
jgi:hypothetical protein